MANAYLRQTPLAHLHLDARAANEAADATTGVHIGERQLLGMINLRGERSNPDLGQRGGARRGTVPWHSCALREATDPGG